MENEKLLNEQKQNEIEGQSKEGKSSYYKEKTISFTVGSVYENEIKYRFCLYKDDSNRGLGVMAILWIPATVVQFIHVEQLALAMFCGIIVAAFIYFLLCCCSLMLDWILRKHNLKHFIKKYKRYHYITLLGTYAGFYTKQQQKDIFEKYALEIGHLIEYHNKEVKYKWRKISDEEARELCYGRELDKLEND
jgi:hypothetical protein